MKYRIIIILTAITFISNRAFANGTDSLVVKNYDYEQIEELRNFPELRYLKIDFYKDTVLPKSIGDLTQLEYLEINFAKITSLPSSIGRLINLKTLIISNGYVNLKIPTEIGNLILLKELNIYNYHFSSLPFEIGNLVNLEETMLCGDMVDLPSSIVNWTKLKSLYLAGNKFNYIPTEIFELEQLKYLDLERNELLEVNDSITMLLNLNDLNLAANIQIDKLPDAVCKLGNLKTLDISNTKISSVPSCLANIESFETLKMCKTIINDPQKIEKIFGERIEWDGFCRYLKHSLVDYSEIYGNYTLKYRTKKDTTILDYNYFYNEPGVIDEEYNRSITVKIINLDSLKLNKIYTISNPNFIVITSRFSVWDWSNARDNNIEGYIQIVEISQKRFEIYLNLDLINLNDRRKLVDKLLIFKK